MRLIDADELVKAFNEAQVEFDEYYKGLGRAKVITDNAPTVEPTFGMFRTMLCETCQAYATNRAIAKLSDDFTRPQGEWIYTNKEDKEKGYGGYCSVCKCDMPIGMNDWKQEYYESKFCPNCGAEMKGEENE